MRAAYQRVRRVRLLLLRGGLEVLALGLSLHVNRIRIAGHTPRVEVEALSSWPSGSSLVCTKIRSSVLWEWMSFHRYDAEYAGLGGTSQSPWLLCM